MIERKELARKEKNKKIHEPEKCEDILKEKKDISCCKEASPITEVIGKTRIYSCYLNIRLGDGGKVGRCLF